MTTIRTQTAPEEPQYIRLENPWHPWLYMELAWRPSTHKDRAHIDLTISFSEDWLQTRFGRLKFGFCSGDLKIQITNGIIPLKTRKPANLLQLEVPKERSITKGTKEVHEKGATVGISLQGGVPASATEISNKSGTEHSKEISDKFTISDWQIIPKGSPDGPVWSFKAQEGKPVLLDKLIDYELGLVHINRRPCTLLARFVIARSEIWFTGAEGFWASSMTQNSGKLIYQVIRKWIWERFQPEVGLVEVRHV